MSQLSVEVESLFAEARERGRREFADQLNQAVRRIRQSLALDELTTTLVDVTGDFSMGAALFRIDGETARGNCIHGLPEEATGHFRELEIPLSAAAALAAAVESRDPVVTATAPFEVSERLASLLGHDPESRASLYPIVAGGGVPAVVYVWGAVEGSAIELLTQVAASVWNEIARPPAPPLVQIAPAPEAPAPAETSSAWERLSVEEQQIHFRAQRCARVQAAEMRLHEPEAVQAGRTRRDLYNALRKPIDAGRETFRSSFFAVCPSMVDYFHLELVRTLANDDAELLGKDYPGPMV